MVALDSFNDKLDEDEELDVRDFVRLLVAVSSFRVLTSSELFSLASKKS